jgi:hypothetical protein
MTKIADFAGSAFAPRDLAENNRKLTLNHCSISSGSAM